MRIRHAALLAGLLCVMVAGCTTLSQGKPTPATSLQNGTADSTPSSTGSEDDLPSHGAPKVETPLDTANFQQNPCSSLTAAQLKELNLPAAGKQEEIPYGIGCEWQNRDTRGMVSVGFLTGNDRGLSAVYAANERDPFPYFTPLPDIEGHPVVASDIEDRRPTGRCIVDLGVTDQLIVDIVVQLSAANIGDRDPCEVAVQVAEMALVTMKAGA